MYGANIKMDTTRRVEERYDFCSCVPYLIAYYSVGFRERLGSNSSCSVSLVQRLLGYIGHLELFRVSFKRLFWFGCSSSYHKDTNERDLCVCVVLSSTNSLVSL